MEEKASLSVADASAETKKEEKKAAKKIKAEYVSPVDTDQKIAEYDAKLADLRREGATKIYQLKEEIYDIKQKQMIDEFTKKKIIDSDKQAIVEAKKVVGKSKELITSTVKKAVVYTKSVSKPYEKKMKADGIALIEKNKTEHNANLEALKAKFSEDLSKLNEINNKKVSAFLDKKPETSDNPEQAKILNKQYKKDLQNLKRDNASDVSSLKIAHSTAVKDENNRYAAFVQQKKDMSYSSFLARYNKLQDLRGGKSSILETLEYKLRTYFYNFNWYNFLISNALYIIVIAFFVACFIIAPFTDVGNILTTSNIYGFLETASSRVFFALGVGGLIVLAGTDLSVGRMIGLGTLCVGFVLHSGDVPATLFNNTINMDAVPMGLRIALALILAIVACTTFSSIAGFFSAKLKMHPFITTLATMLMMYGLMFVATDGIPTGNPNANNINQAIIGRLPGGFPKYVIYAVIAIAIVWFIWNKTKFGKNMFAVGGNPEAASVSGISYFKVTMGVFIMAGILYGFGSFFYAFYSNPAGNTGYGFELDAIAACVVGGISFFGGIGKVKGAVIGCLLFTGLTYVLTLMNVNTYMQFIIKGIILMGAVALDSIKYLKRR